MNVDTDKEEHQSDQIFDISYSIQGGTMGAGGLQIAPAQEESNFKENK